MSDITDGIIGATVECFLLAVFAGSLYRIFGGKFLIPRREIILPYNVGVIVKGTQIIKTVDPGVCWVWPKQRVVLCDIRPRPLQMIGVEGIGSDGGIVRLSLSGEYYVSNPEVFIGVSREAANTFVAATRRAIYDAVREQSSLALVANSELLISRLREIMEPTGKKLGMDFLSLELWEALHTGWVRGASEEATDPIVH